MKKISIAAFACLALFACNDNQKQEKTLRDSIIAIHDKVMGMDDKLMNNKMKIDTLLKTQLTGVKDTTETKKQLMGLKVQLTSAEDQMEKWMQKFDPDQKGKSHEEIMNYYSAQKTILVGVDSAMNTAINASGNYLKEVKN